MLFISLGLDSRLVEMDKKEEEAQAEDRELVESVKDEAEQEREPIAEILGAGVGFFSGSMDLALPIVPVMIEALPTLGIMGVGVAVGAVASRVLNPLVFGSFVQSTAEERVKIQERRYSRLCAKHYDLKHLINNSPTDASQLVQAKNYFEATILRYKKKVTVSTS